MMVFDRGGAVYVGEVSRMCGRRSIPMHRGPPTSARCRNSRGSNRYLQISRPDQASLEGLMVRSRARSMSAKGWDYVVIGAGAAGCVVAGRLSEMLPDARIALIEAGRERLGLTTKVPGIAFIASTFPRQNWNYQTEPVPALNGRRLSWFQGRILGGSSSINGMLYLRGHSLEYDQWAQRGCQGWSFDQVLPYFKKAETNSRGAGEWHGDGGPMAVKQSRLDLPICDAFLVAAGERDTRSSTTSIPMSSKVLAASTPTSAMVAAPAPRWPLRRRDGGAAISISCRKRSRRGSSSRRVGCRASRSSGKACARRSGRSVKSFSVAGRSTRRSS